MDTVTYPIDSMKVRIIPEKAKFFFSILLEVFLNEGASRIDMQRAYVPLLR